MLEKEKMEVDSVLLNNEPGAPVVEVNERELRNQGRLLCKWWICKKKDRTHVGVKRYPFDPIIDGYMDAGEEDGGAGVGGSAGGGGGSGTQDGNIVKTKGSRGRSMQREKEILKGDEVLGVRCRMCYKTFSFNNRAYQAFGKHLPQHHIFDASDVNRCLPWLKTLLRTKNVRENVDVGPEEEDDDDVLKEDETMPVTDLDLQDWITGQRSRGRILPDKTKQGKGKGKEKDQLSCAEKEVEHFRRGGAGWTSRVEMISSFIAADCLPLTMVESTQFRAFMALVDPAMPPICYRTVKKELRRKWKDMKVKIKVKKIIQVSSFTMDFWTTRNGKHMLGVTAHFVWDFKLNSLAIACEEVKEEKLDSIKVGAALVRVMEEIEEVPFFPVFVTDAAGNVSKAVNDDLEWNWYRCAAHLVHN
ncbi:MAG: hypothetical protein AAF587_44775, partial [Bacteroidota bacterium]